MTFFAGQENLCQMTAAKSLRPNNKQIKSYTEYNLRLIQGMFILKLTKPVF